jgi:O-antigen/teichoic acid export membrane protein
LVYGSIDLVLLPFLTDSQTAGEYAFAYRLASMPIFIAAIVTAAVFPTLSRAAGRDAAQFGRVMRRAASITFVATLPLSIGLATLSREVAPLAGGSDFRSAAPLLALLSVHIPLAAADTILGTALFALGRERRFAVVAWAAAVLNPVANVVVVPIAAGAWGDGAIGASIVTIATEAFIGANIWWLLRAFLPLRPMLQGGAGVAALGIAMAAVVLLAVHVAGLIGAVVAGGLAYAAGSAALRIVQPWEVVRAGRALRPGS